MRWLCVALMATASVAIASAGSAAPATPLVAPTATTALTLQQMFNQASSAVETGNCALALPIFERLAADPRVKAGSLPAATIAVRRGICLANLGQDEDAERQMAIGLPIIAKSGPTMAIDVSAAEEALGNVAMRRRDHDGAVGYFKRAIVLLAEPARIRLLVRLAQATQFDGGAAPVGFVDQALRIASSAPKPDRPTLAVVHTVRGRILLNENRNAEALAEFKQALALSGGLSLTNVSLAEVALRSDLAEASLLTGDKEQARIFLSYTGAGRIEESPFASAASMVPPQCGPETGLTADDFAIVEFEIDDAGDVPFATTVYTRGNHKVASAFANAVEQWYWRPEDLKKIPHFYRALTRVELRCSRSGGDLPGIFGPLSDRFKEWAAPLLGNVDFENYKVGNRLDQLTSLAANRERDGDMAGAVAALTLRGVYDPGARVAQSADFDRSLQLATAARLPAEVVNSVLVFRYAATMTGDRRRRSNTEIAQATNTLLASNPALATDALASDTLALLTTTSTPSETQRVAVVAALTRVSDDQRLPEHHPLKQVALMRLANISAAGKNLAEANGYFDRTGLSEEQCSLIAVPPAMKHSGADSSDFPSEALKYGFEGWVNLEYDINANGTTAHPRPVIAYPPFVFVDAATGMARGFRYQTSFRPSSQLACSANRATVRFLMPNR